jgi:hypothetical protein
MYGRPYPQRVAAYPQLVGAYPGFPQLVGRAGYPHLVGATPQVLANWAPPGAQGFAHDPNGATGFPLMGQNPGSTGTVLMDGTPSQTRQWLFPMPAIDLLPNNGGDVSNTAQLIIRPTRITIAETAGPSSITDLIVGQRSQFINRGGEFPVSAFENVAVDSLVNFDTAAVGNSVTIAYRNRGADSTTITTGLFCVTAAY